MQVIRYYILFLIAGCLCLFSGNAQGFLKTQGKKIVNAKGENVLLRGIGLGGWMLQEPYMFQLSDVAGTQTEIKAKISGLIGKANCDEFYARFLSNMITEKDIEAHKSWGFNSVRLPMHYNLFTLSVENEPVKGQNTSVSYTHLTLPTKRI